MFYILSIRREGDEDKVAFIGPFEDGEVAFQYGLGNTVDDLRWCVINIGEPIEYGMFFEEPVNAPFFGFLVEAP